MTAARRLLSLLPVFPPFYESLFATFAFLLGASIGSFLNVCIYRMPLGLSVNEPKRSFCPSCKYQIPWWCNLPLLSWLSLRGKCANCGARISFRYFGVELLTALLFLAVWWRVFMDPRAEWDGQGWVLALPYWILAGLLIVATFIDFEHLIIPDEITIGGAVAGLLLSFAMPILMNEHSNLAGLLWSIGGAALGYGLLWGVVELGKLAFGKKHFKVADPTDFKWTLKAMQTEQGEEKDADLIVGDIAWKSLPPPSFIERIARYFRQLFHPGNEPAQGESWIWSETFMRDSDQLLIQAPSVSVDGEPFTDVTMHFSHETLKIGERQWQLEKVRLISGKTTRVIIPREAMGFGDVKFMATIGAFLGWKAVLFTVMSASVVGAVVGVSTIALGRREWSTKIPFGPYLALGALIWLFDGPEIVRWYLATLAPAPL